MFKKGHNVTIIRQWNMQGAVYSTKAVVYSCGKKQMVLTCATTGAELGRNFQPQAEQWNGVVIMGHDDATIEAAALELSAQIIAKSVARSEAIMNNAKFAENPESYRTSFAADHEAMKRCTPAHIVRNKP